MPIFIALQWPPNCAILHSSAMPAFKYSGDPGGPFATSLTVLNADGAVIFAFRDYRNVRATLTSTPIVLANGHYFWSVSTSRPSGAGGGSETWEFTIDTTCGCTDTPTPTTTGKP